jgi:hypothetical protein
VPGSYERSLHTLAGEVALRFRSQNLRDGHFRALPSARELGRRSVDRDVPGVDFGPAGRGHYRGALGTPASARARCRTRTRRSDLRQDRGLAGSGFRRVSCGASDFLGPLDRTPRRMHHDRHPRPNSLPTVSARFGRSAEIRKFYSKIDDRMFSKRSRKTKRRGSLRSKSSHQETSTNCVHKTCHMRYAYHKSLYCDR